MPERKYYENPTDSKKTLLFHHIGNTLGSVLLHFEIIAAGGQQDEQFDFEEVRSDLVEGLERAKKFPDDGIFTEPYLEELISEITVLNLQDEQAVRTFLATLQAQQ